VKHVSVRNFAGHPEPVISIPEGSSARKCRVAPFRQNLAHELVYEYVSRFGLTSSAAGRRMERSEGAPIPTICCGVCAARLFGTLSAVTHAGGESMREILSEKHTSRPVGDRIRTAW